MYRTRHAATIVEVLVVVAILAAVMSLVLVAVQQVRAEAGRLTSMNNIRQLMLGVHNKHARQGYLPDIDWGFFVFSEGILDDAGIVYRDSDANIGSLQQNKSLINPLDPSIRVRNFGPAMINSYTTLCSYAPNYQVFSKGERKIDRDLPDGLSTTIGLAEHYSLCRDSVFTFHDINPGGFWRRASFADRGRFPQGIINGVPDTSPPRFGTDVIPVTTGNSPTTRASTTGLTFQVRPRFEDCNPLIPQTPHSSGMLVGWMDGSVRPIRGGVSEAVFWGAVTPAGGEVLSLD